MRGNRTLEIRWGMEGNDMSFGTVSLFYYYGEITRKVVCRNTLNEQATVILRGQKEAKYLKRKKIS